jgi:cytochrome c556
MKGLQAHRAAMTAVLDGEAGESGHLLGHARSLSALATMTSDVFAEGTGGPGSRAREEIWSNSADFAEAVSAIQSAAGALVEAAEAGDMARIQESAQAFGQTCAGCHRAFRARAGG